MVVTVAVAVGFFLAGAAAYQSKMTGTVSSFNSGDDMILEEEEVLVEKEKEVNTALEQMREKSINTVRIGEDIGRINTYFTRECPGVQDWKWYSEPRNMPSPKKCMSASLFYIKGAKTGSTTISSVARRIAARFALGGVNETHSAPPYRHPVMPTLSGIHIYSKRNGNEVLKMEQSLTTNNNGQQELPIVIMASVRDPAQRCLSQFFHKAVSVLHQEVNKENLEKWQRRRCRNFLYKYYSMKERISNEYGMRDIDFMIVNERMSESFAVLGHYLHLSYGDLLYIAAKNSSLAMGLSSRGIEYHLTKHQPLSQQPKWVKDILLGENFEQKNALDYVLYNASVRALDKRIEEIGAERVSGYVTELNSHLKAIKQECKQASQDLNQCIVQDQACAFDCITDYATRNSLYKPLYLT